MLRHIIFDLDGTLIDTEGAVLKTWAATLADYGYAPDADKLRCVLGVPTHTGLERLGASVDENYMKRWQGHYARFASEAKYFPGAEEMLKALKNMGFALGVVTSRCRREYADFFSGYGFETLFSHVVLEEDTHLHKPDPEPLKHYMALANAAPNECIYIGDMSGDVLSARHAGVCAALALWSHPGAAAEADVLFETPQAVTRYAQAQRH